MLLYVIAYDIPCNKRRKKISDLLEGYGKRVQFSVFECVLTQEKYRELLKRLQPKVQPKEDSVRCYPISGHTLEQIVILGGAPLTTPPGSVII